MPRLIPALAFPALLGALATCCWAAAAPQTQLFPVPPPPFTEGIYPCSDCHADQKTNPVRRVLTEEHAAIVLHHAEEMRWCLDCHDADDRDKLHLQSGEKIAFTDSQLLCGQCHGTQYRDWRAGAHGKRTGSWNGKKQYLLCAHCHNPHQPRFKPLKPEPPPLPEPRWNGNILGGR